MSRPIVVDPVLLPADLRAVDPVELEGDPERTAFWLNAYNALITDWLRLNPPRRSMLRELRLFGRAAYRLGGFTYTPDQIEHGLLRRNRRPPYRPRRVLRATDPRLLAAPSRFDARIHFALNCGARSCPPIRGYRAADVDGQLEAATKSYLQAETEVDAAAGTVVLPGLMRLYRRDFGSRAAAIRFVAERVPALEQMILSTPAPAVSYGRFDWTAAAPAQT